MDAELRAWIDRRFRIADGPSKVVSLSEAVAAHVRPGDVLHLGMTHTRGSAAWWEILRRFIGTDPGFTLCGVAISSPVSPLVHARLANKVITSWAGDSYWTPGPNGVYQRAWKAGLPFEQWSILTYVERLKAGARGVPWTTTRSLTGSTMVERNGLSERDGVVEIPALVPDVSIFHAPAADARGNVLFSPPLMEGLWGALAARRGCVVTVERIVDDEFVRSHAHMTKLPASSVLAVVEAPYGGHPGGLSPVGIEGAAAYGEDYEFWVEIRNAAKDPGAMDAWIRDNVLDTRTHEGYLERLGSERLARLRARADVGHARADLEEALHGVDVDAAPNAVETAIVGAARALASAIRGDGYATMLAGAGMANLAAWLAAFALAEEDVRVDLVAEMGLVGYRPQPGEPILFNQRNFPSCTMLTDIEGALGVIVGGGSARSVGALGAAQVDKHGNINSTEVPGGYLLMGSGGANDVVTCATESVVICAQSRERLVERVPYITGAGTRVRTLVTTMGIYRKDEAGELVLTQVFDADVETAVKESLRTCGWDLRVARDVDSMAPPTHEEIRTLRVVDPRAWFRG